LKQSGWMWNEIFNKVLISLNLEDSFNNHVYIYKKDNNNNIKCIVDIYVDDIILSGTDA